MTESGQQIGPDRIPQIPASDLTSNAIALLLRLLGQPQSLDQDPLHRLQPTGQHLLMRTVLRPQEVSDAVRTRSDAVLESLPEWLRHDAQAVHLHSPGKGPLQWVGKAEPKFLTRKSTSEYPYAGALVVDDLAIADPIFTGLSDRDLMALGVPEEMIPAVRTIRSEGDPETPCHAQSERTKPHTRWGGNGQDGAGHAPG